MLRNTTQSCVTIRNSIHLEIIYYDMAQMCLRLLHTNLPKLISEGDDSVEATKIPKMEPMKRPEGPILIMKVCFLKRKPRSGMVRKLQVL